MRESARGTEGWLSRSSASRSAAIAVAITVMLSLAMTVLKIDISDRRDFDTDAVNLPLNRPAELNRYADPSPFSIWLPSDLFVWDSIRSGHLPLWNRLQGGGYSPVVSLQEGVLHPLRWLMAIYPRDIAPSVFVLWILASACTGMYLLARHESRLSAPVALATALVFALSPLMISFSQFTGASLPLAHTPWLIFFYRRTQSVRAPSFVALVLSIALLAVSGHPLLIACVVFTAGLVACGDAFARKTIRPLVMLGAAGVLGALVASPALLPLLVSRSEVWTYKTNTYAGYSYVMYSIEGWLAAMRALVIDVYPYGTCCVDLDAYFLYLGIPMALLMIVGVRVMAESREGKVTIAILTFAFLIAIPGPWMIVALRMLSFFKPWYLAGAFIFIGSWVAGRGLEFFYTADRARRIAAIVLALATVGLYAMRSRELLRPRRLAPERSSAALQLLRAQPGPFRVTGLWGQMHIPNSSRLTGIEDLRLSAPILSLRYHWWWRLVDPDVLRRAFPTTRVSDRLESPLVSDFNVAFLLQSRLMAVTTYRSDPDESLLDSFKSPYSDRYPLIFRNRWMEIRRIAERVNPRAHFVNRAVAVPDLVSAAQLLERQPLLPRVAHVVEIVDPPALPRQMSGSVGVRYPSDGEVVLDIRTPTGGIVVLHDTFARGWTARMGGEELPLYPVNILSRGVIVPAGAHQVTMSYRPSGFLPGALLSFLTLAALIASRFWQPKSRAEELPSTGTTPQ